MEMHYTTVDTWSWSTDNLAKETSTLVVNVDLTGILQDALEHSVDDSTPPCAARQFLLDKARGGSSLVKVLLPVQSGHIVQSDFLERRMVDCLNVADVRGFIAPGQHVQGCSVEAYESMKLTDLLHRCYGAIVVSSSSTGDNSTAVNEELVKRLSFDWLSPKPITRKRLVFIGGASQFKFQGFAIAAASLNVGLVVLDEPNQWIASDSYAHLREEFVPFDMTPDASMARRITEAVAQKQNASYNGKSFDGIMTLDEHLLTIVSHAATLLGLPTSSPESIGLAQNKFQTRQLDANVFCRLVRSVADLEKLLVEEGPRILYPLIVKPSKGWSSEGVWKVADEQQLRIRVAMLWQDAFTAWHGHDIVIETYVDGPEVDANMVLVNGEIVFFEANDDFPSPGDYDDGKAKVESGPVPNFVETGNMLPSALAPCELEALQQRLHELVLSAGFRDGILHIEARLRNSSSHYATDNSASGSNGFVDLRRNTATTSTAKPEDVFLLEINPRQPGWFEINATEHTYGVSYYSLAVLHALADRNRIVTLSQPFLGGAQYHMQLLVVSAQKGGIYQSGDVCSAVIDQAEHLRAHVVQCANLMAEGQIVPDPRTGMVFGNFIAFFLIVSRTSRSEALRVGHEIEQLVRVYTGGF
ncbi:fumipyrrole biosynthesis protein C [Colletotrichum spaethianum]|uniref:Fumipyrrole biosynthesis protein C n=1 Tax=Colletotrichum spaethianum TaxID=700344 RepID=A0AA37L767_9PEZI|nr:fumipyrrole biosynthesis protein C [Colletotrichum spaethianum]GKT43051.1 fumipyrrole biosynthesis protein C [Colletotrichum spaethianum]